MCQIRQATDQEKEKEKEKNEKKEVEGRGRAENSADMHTDLALWTA